MNNLERRFAALRWQLRVWSTWRGLCAFASFIIGPALLIAVADRYLLMPSVVRAAMLVGLLVGSAIVAYRWLLRPLLAPSDDLSLALKVEDKFPELNDALASTVQFLQLPEGGHESAPIRRAAVAKTLEDSHEIRFGAVVADKSTRWLTLAAGLIVLMAGFILYNQPAMAATAVMRLVDPFGMHTWTSIAMDKCPQKVAINQRYEIHGALQGVIPDKARIEIESLSHADAQVPIKDGAFVAVLDLTRQAGKFRFRVVAGDGTFPPTPGTWHEVAVMPPPKLASLEGKPSPQLAVSFPSYTGIPPQQKLAAGVGHLENVGGAPVTFGTQVHLRAAADRPLADAWIEYLPDVPALRNRALLAHLGHGPLPAQFENEQRTIFHIDFTPWTTGEYALVLVDEDGLAGLYRYDLRLKADPIPLVGLLKPSSAMSLLPDAQIDFHVRADDEFFGLRSVFLEYRKKDQDGQFVDAGATRLWPSAALPAQGAEKTLRVFSPATAQSAALLPPQTGQAEFSARWSLDNQFKKGETVVLNIAADDYCDIYLSREPGRSHEIELRIVDAMELNRILGDGLAKARDEVLRLQKLQDEALKIVDELKANPEVKDRKDQDRLLEKMLEAQQLERQLFDRVGPTQDQGLRGELSQMQQMMKANKLPSNDTQEHLQTLKIELDRLAQEDLPRLEPSLVEAQKDLLDRALQDNKKTDKGDSKKGDNKQDSPLDKSQAMQRDVKKSLDNMAKDLDPWASMHLVRGKTQDLLQEQKHLKDDTTNALNLKEELNKLDPNQPDIKSKLEDIDAAMKRKAEQQKGLRDEGARLLEMMNSAKDNRAKENDDDAVRKLSNAARLGNNLPKNLGDAGDKLQKKPLEAAQQQEENVQQLEQMLSALEGKQNDDLDRLQKKRNAAKEGQEEIEKLANDQEKLQKKVQDAKALADPAERAAKLKELSKEQEALEEKTREEARELARLQEEKASKKLSQAAQEMEKARQLLDQGADPEQEQEEALDRINEAQDKLDDFQEQLAREQIAKIADRIKGLKEREDAAAERSQDSSQRIIERKRWNKDQLDTLDGERETQEGLSTETQSLQEKLKDALVFAHVLEKAGKTMDDAAHAMAVRREKARDRQLDEMEKEELSDETQQADAIQKLQKLASERLGRLLEALKNDPLLVKNNPDEKNGGDGQGGGEPGQGGEQQKRGGLQAQDGIPETAELKVLRGEQVDVNEQTKEFARLHPNIAALTDAERTALESIQTEQARLHELFARMTAAAAEQK